MRKLLFISTLLVIFSSCKQNVTTPEFDVIHNEKTERIDSLINALYKNDEFNGNILVAENGRIIYQNSLGLANEETGEELNLETAFELASVSKQFTAMGIVQLQKEGKLSYDDSISQYIPELESYEGITIKNLLVHTGGLPDYMYILDKEWGKTEFATNKGVLNLFQELQPEKEFEPGETFSYSNTGYLALATIIERVSGKTFEEYLKEKIFTPLNMDNTFVYRRRYQSKEVDNYALGYIYSDSLKGKILPDEKGKDFYYVYLDGIVGDGMVNSNLHDLLRWDRALYDNTLINDEDKEMIFSSYPMKEDNETNYGFGWFVAQDSLYGKVVSHSGRWAGYLTNIARDIDTDKTIIVLQNNDTKISKNPSLNIRKILYDQPIEIPYMLPEETLKHYAGTYIGNKEKEDEIVYEFDRLWAHNIFELAPISETKFVVIGFTPEVTYDFILDEDGEVMKYHIQQIDTGVDQIGLRKE